MNRINLLKNQALVSTLMDDEMVLLDMETGEYFVLNKVGAIVWELLDEITAIDVITGRVVQRFDVSQDQAEDDVRRFLDDLLEKGMVVTDESA